MESCNQQSIRRFFSGVIKHHFKHRKWHYAITLRHSNPNSLASLLKLTIDQLKILLVAMGLATTTTSLFTTTHKLTLRKKRMERLLDFTERLHVDVYFEKMDVSRVYNGVIDPPTEYKGWWIGMGNKSLYRTKSSINPSS